MRKSAKRLMVFAGFGFGVLLAAAVPAVAAAASVSMNDCVSYGGNAVILYDGDAAFCQGGYFNGQEILDFRR